MSIEIDPTIYQHVKSLGYEISGYTNLFQYYFLSGKVAQKNDLNTINYLYKRGVLNVANACLTAARYGHLDILNKFINEVQDKDWKIWILVNALEYKQNTTIDWYLKMRLPLTSLHLKVAKRCYPDILENLQKAFDTENTNK